MVGRWVLLLRVRVVGESLREGALRKTQTVMAWLCGIHGRTGMTPRASVALGERRRRCH